MHLKFELIFTPPGIFSVGPHYILFCSYAGLVSFPVTRGPWHTEMCGFEFWLVCAKFMKYVGVLIIDMLSSWFC
jgi:hypothetical protein